MVRIFRSVFNLGRAGADMRGPAWPESDISFLVRSYSELSNKEISRQMGRSLSAINNMANKLRLKKPEKFFSPFKAGMTPIHAVPLGSIRTDFYGYKQIKTENGWERLHVIIWKREKGAYDANKFLVRFKDGNKENIDIDNLELITKGAIMKDNSMHNLPKHLKEVIHLKATVTNMIRRLHG